MRYPDVVSLKQINEWIYEQGLPVFVPKPRSDAFTIINGQIGELLSNNILLKQLPTDSWTLHEWLHFINNLPLNISIKRMTELDHAFNLTNSKNAEVAHAWYLLSLKVGYDDIYPALETYLIKIGRRKLIVPLYKQLVQSSEGKSWAINVYQKAKPGYHGLTRGTVESILIK